MFYRIFITIIVLSIFHVSNAESRIDTIDMKYGKYRVGKVKVKKYHPDSLVYTIKVGKWTIYDETGLALMKVKYKKNLLHGKVKYLISDTTFNPHVYRYGVDLLKEDFKIKTILFHYGGLGGGNVYTWKKTKSISVPITGCVVTRKHTIKKLFHNLPRKILLGIRYGFKWESKYDSKLSHGWLINKLPPEIVYY